jgi:hypothetical protein
MQTFRLYSFHPDTSAGFRVFCNKRDGFYQADKEPPVIGLAVIKLPRGSSSVTKIVPTFVFEGETCFGREGFDSDTHEIVIVPPGVENAEDYAYSELARILPCPELDGPAVG